MNIDKQFLDNLTAQAKESPRFRMNLDLRNSSEDSSQRMLNAIEPGSVIPIHRHQKTSETVVILCGRAVQHLYDDEGRLVESVLLAPVVAGCPVKPGMTEGDELRSDEEGDVLRSGEEGDGLRSDEDVVSYRNGEPIPAMNVEKGQWHRLEALESGTVIVEFKDGAYEPIGPEDILILA